MDSTTSEVMPVEGRDESISQNESSDELRAEIEATRSQMSGTVDAIQAKLSPQNVQETTQNVVTQVKEAALEVADTVRERVKHDIRNATVGKVERMVGNMSETTRGASSSILETIKQNPIPAALVGVGLAWLMMNKSNGSADSRQGYQRDYYRQYDYNDSFEDRSRSGRMAGVANKAEHVVGDVKEKASDVVERVQDRADQLSDRIQDGAQQAKFKSADAFQGNPLVIGAVAIALGAAVGSMLPETQRENELMGEMRDKLINQASDVVQEKLGQVQQVAKEAVNAAKDTAKSEARSQGLVSNGK